LYTGKVFAQKKKRPSSRPNPTLILADKHYNNLEYYLAAHEYGRVLKSDSSNAYAMYQMAECFRMYFDYKSAEIYYQKVATRFRDKYPLARFWYATMLKDNANYERAILNFEKYREEHIDTDLETELYREKAAQEIKGCYIAIEERNKPKKDYGFRCLPRPVNSHESDYSPVLFEHDSSIALTSSRRGSVGGYKDNSLGGAFTDVYRFTKEKDTVWSLIKQSQDDFHKLNTQYNESSGSFTANQSKYYFTRCDEVIKVDNYEEFNCAIYVSYNKNGKWEKPFRLNENINTPGQWNSQPSVSPDGNILFFVSKRPGGLGLHDIWYSTCNGDDNWGPPINLGDKINTLFIDVSPRYYAEQKVLFFSSNGHGGHGGLDIFMTKEEDGFQNIINLGYPFNSNRDDFYFVLGEKKGYITSNREGGVGNDDIYTFDIKSKRGLIHQIEDSTATEDDEPPLVTDKPVIQEQHVADIQRDRDGAEKLTQITGRLIDSTSNTPAPNLEVSLLDEYGDVVARSFTNEKGEYNFNNQPNNKDFKIVFKNPDANNQFYKTPVPTINYTTIAVESRQELIGKVAKDNSAVPRTLHVSGVVSDSLTRKPSASVEVQVLDEVGNVLLTAYTNEKGEYKFENLPTTTNLRVVLVNRNPKENAYHKGKLNVVYKEIPTPLVDKEAYVTTVLRDSLQDKKAFVVQGTVKLQGATTPVSKGQVLLLSEDGDIIKAVSVDASGKYRLESSVVSDNVKVVYRATGKESEVYLTTQHKVTYVPLVTVPQTTEALIATINKDSLPHVKSITIEGTILFEDTKKPAPEAVILLVDESGSTLKTAKTDKNGYYKFSNLPSGKTYKVILQQGSMKGQASDKRYYAEKVSVTGSEVVATRRLFENIYFDFDSYSLRSEAVKVLDELVEYAVKESSIQIEMHANTDSYGSAQYNKILSAKRGQAAFDYLKGKGVPQSSMVVNALGEDKSIATNETELGRQLNRRVEFYILGGTPIEAKAMAYVIEPNKTLQSLASEYNMTVEELKELNGLVGDDLVAYTPIRVKRRSDINDIIAPATRQQAYSKKHLKLEQQLMAKNEKINRNFDHNNPEYRKYLDSAENAERKQLQGDNRYEGSNIAYYITQPKNTLYNIARLYGVPVDDLKKINNLNNDTIYIGQKIKVDFNLKDPSIRGYLVKEGDTIGEIAKRFGLTINELLDINNLDGYILRKNMILRLKKD
jgi:outer membrane protein OmpA-like peptidoglycan-associated protein